MNDEAIKKTADEMTQKTIVEILSGKRKMTKEDFKLVAPHMSYNQWDQWRLRFNKELKIEDGHVTDWRDKGEWHNK